MKKDNKQNNFQKLLLSFKILQNISGNKIIERSIQKNSSDRTETSSRERLLFIKLNQLSLHFIIICGFKILKLKLRLLSARTFL